MHVKLLLHQGLALRYLLLIDSESVVLAEAVPNAKTNTVPHVPQKYSEVTLSPPNPTPALTLNLATILDLAL